MDRAAGVKRAAEVALTFAIAATGGFAAQVAGLPVPWLIGSALFVAAASLFGAPIRLPTLARDAAYLLLGALAGSSITPEVLQQVALWPLSFVIQLIGVYGVIFATMLYLQRALGWDRQTAFFAALPGALTLVIATASQTRADLLRVVVVQSVRLLVLLVVLAPFLAWLEGDVGGAVVVRGTAPSELPLAMIALFCVVVLICAYAGDRLRLPGGIFLGALLGSGLLHGADIAPLAIPEPLVLFGLLAIGVVIGSRVRHEHRLHLLRLLPASLSALAIGFAVAGLSGLAAHFLLGIDLGPIAVAYAPGALEALVAIAYQFDVDPAYVAAHHVVRFVALSITIPLLARWLAAAPKVSAEAEEPPRSDS